MVTHSCVVVDDDDNDDVIKCRALCMLGKHSTIELKPQPGIPKVTLKVCISKPLQSLHSLYAHALSGL